MKALTFFFITPVTTQVTTDGFLILDTKGLKFPLKKKV